jgi:hypothetical protein
MELFFRQETREERQDVFTIYTIDKGLNDENTEIIDIENKIKENTTKDALLKEVDTLQSTIDEATAKQNELNTMITMIDNFVPNA